MKNWVLGMVRVACFVPMFIVFLSGCGVTVSSSPTEKQKTIPIIKPIIEVEGEQITGVLNGRVVVIKDIKTGQRFMVFYAGSGRVAMCPILEKDKKE